MSFFAMPTKPVAKKPIPGKPQAVKPAQKNVVQKKPAPAKAKGLRLLKETPQASLVQKKPAPDRVENLAKAYLAELREVDITFQKGTTVLEKYRIEISGTLQLYTRDRSFRAPHRDKATPGSRMPPGGRPHYAAAAPASVPPSDADLLDLQRPHRRTDSADFRPRKQKEARGLPTPVTRIGR